MGTNESKEQLRRVIARRVVAACSTVPDGKGWLLAAGLLAAIGVIALPAGFALGFLRIDPITSWRAAAGVAALSFVLPAMVEELLFRVLLLPRSEERVTAGARWLWGMAGLVLFVASHPIKAYAFFPARQAAFTDPAFLLLATLLGLACTIAYLRSGSLWPPVFIHWIVVVAWLLVFGGYRKLHG